MFEVNPNREFKFEYEVGKDEWISVTFDFPYAEEVDYGPGRDLLKDIPEFKKDEHLKVLRGGGTITKDQAEFETESKSVQILYGILRKSLIGWTGFGDKTTGKELPLKDVKGKIIEKNQLCIFDVVKKEDRLISRIVKSYLGEGDLGNSKIGLPQDSSSDGAQNPVEGATSEESVTDASS